MRICALLACLGLAGVAALTAADTTPVEQIVAKVNGDIITKSDLERAKREVAASLRSRNLKPAQLADALKEAEESALRDKIDQLLLVQRGKELNINVDSDVSKYLAQIQLENKIADPEKFQQWLREQTGMPYEDFKQETKNGILTQRVIGQEVSSKINIAREEIEAYYKQHREEFKRQEKVFLREILISTEGKDAAGKAAAEKKAKDIVARARKGERFAELVRDNSDAVTAKQGGDLGGFGKGEIRADMEKMVWDKQRNYVTDPIAVDAGFLILRVEDHHREGQATLEDVENDIKERLYMPRMQPKVREYLTQLRSNAFLEIREGYKDSGAISGQNTAWQDPAMLRAETVSKEEVALQTHIRKVLWAFPVPGTKAGNTGKSTSK